MFGGNGDVVEHEHVGEMSTVLPNMLNNFTLQKRSEKTKFS